MSRKIERNAIVTILLWSIAAAVLAFVLSLIASAFLLKETIGQGSVPYLSWGIMALSVFAAAAIGCKTIVSDKRFAVALGIGVAFYLYTVLVKVLAFPGAFHNLWINLALCLASGLLAFVATSRRKKRGAVKANRRR